MPYLGKTPSQGVRARYQFTPDAGATSVSGADANGSTMTFTDGNYVDVYLNGVMLKAGTDYNTNTANTIASLVATVASDVVDVIVYDTFSLFGGTLEGNVTVNNGTFNVTGAVDFDSTLNVDGAITGTSATLTTADNTTQLTLVSTDADANTGPQLDLYRNSSSPADDDYIGRVKFIGRNDASQDFTGVDFIGRTIDVSDGTEDATLFINTMTGGTTYNRLNITPTEIVINEESRDLDFRVESNGNANMLFVDGGTDAVMIGTTDEGYPDYADTLTVANNASTSDRAGITIRAGTAGQSAIYFSDATGTAAGTYQSSMFHDHSGGYLSIFTQDFIKVSTGSNERMRIDSSGKVGIGITPLASTTGNGLGAAFSTLTIKASDTVTQALSIDATNAAGPNFMISSYSDGSGSYYMLGANLLLDTSGNTAFESNGENMSGIILDSRAGNGIQFITAAHDGSSYVPAERMRVHNSGVVSFNNGIELGSGLDATAANTLDDYEEGSFTPTGNNITLSTAEGRFTKIGNVVRIGMYLVFPSTSDTNDAYIGSLPFTCTNLQSARSGLVIAWHNVSSSNGLSILTTSNATTAYFYLSNVGKTNANMSGASVYVGGTYITDS